MSAADAFEVTTRQQATTARRRRIRIPIVKLRSAMQSAHLSLRRMERRRCDTFRLVACHIHRFRFVFRVERWRDPSGLQQRFASQYPTLRGTKMSLDVAEKPNM